MDGFFNNSIFLHKLVSIIQLVGILKIIDHNNIHTIIRKYLNLNL